MKRQPDRPASLGARRVLCALAVLGAGLPLAAATKSQPLPGVPKWGVFDTQFRSTTRSTQAWPKERLTLEFTAPDGTRFAAAGFWDGRNVWRARFSPSQPGVWNYRTSCSDVANRGLHGVTGRFLCTVTTNQNRLAQHGPVQVAPDGTHFEHADHTPFLWLGDAAWEARPVPSPRAVGRQAKRRAAEKFTAVQWALASGKDAEGLAKFKRGSPATINLDFCRALDAKIATLNSAGLLAVLAPLWEIGVAPGSVLPEEQAIALGRYAVARWGAQHVAWVVALEGQSLGARVSRWQRLGRAVFGAAAHGPVLLWPGDALWLLDEFRGEPWVDALGYQTQQVVNDDGLQWLFAGPLNVEWQKAPVRPLLNLAPPARPGASLGPDAARRLLWWSLLLGPVAGTSCRAAAATTNDLWAVARLSDLMASIEFWRLQPAPRAVVGQPGWLVPRRHIAAAATPERDLLVVYTPEDRAVELALAALPPAPEANWFDPRTGEKFPARYAVSGQTARLVTPAAGDWVLVMRAGG